MLNVAPGEHVDHVGTADDLSRFPDATFAAIYPYDERPTQSLNGRTMLVSK